MRGQYVGQGDVAGVTPRRGGRGAQHRLSSESERMHNPSDLKIDIEAIAYYVCMISRGHVSIPSRCH